MRSAFTRAPGHTITAPALRRGRPPLEQQERPLGAPDQQIAPSIRTPEREALGRGYLSHGADADLGRRPWPVGRPHAWPGGYLGRWFTAQVRGWSRPERRG